MKKIQTIILCALFTLTGCKEAARQQESGGKDEYPTMTVKRENRQLTASYPATLRGRQDVEIRPQVSGKVVRVCVGEGQKVRKGQTLFVIDQTPYREALTKARAALATAEANEATARQTLESQRLLRQNNIVSDFAVRTEENNYKSAVAQDNPFPLRRQSRVCRQAGHNSGAIKPLLHCRCSQSGTPSGRIGNYSFSSLQKPFFPNIFLIEEVSQHGFCRLSTIITVSETLFAFHSRLGVVL